MSCSKLSLNSIFNYDLWVHAVSGATGGVFAMTVFYPLDTVRARLQLEEFNQYKNENTLKILNEIYKMEGFTSLYRGLVPVLQSLCISNFVYFYTFHGLKTLIGNKRQQSAMKDLLLGCIAGAINVLTTTPFWVVNTRLKMKGLQSQQQQQQQLHRDSTINLMDNAKNYNSLLEGLIYIGKTEGIKGLWSGTIPSLILVINPALQFMMYEQIKRKLIQIYGENNISSVLYFLIGALSKAFATLITYPLQLAQTKLRHGTTTTTGNDISDNNLKTNMGTIQLLLRILKTQGPKGLFRGLEAKILQTVMTAALMFATYEKIAKYVAMILISQKNSNHLSKIRKS